MFYVSVYASSAGIISIAELMCPFFFILFYFVIFSRASKLDSARHSRSIRRPSISRTGFRYSVASRSRLSDRRFCIPADSMSHWSTHRLILLSTRDALLRRPHKRKSRRERLFPVAEPLGPFAPFVAAR